MTPIRYGAKLAVRIPTGPRFVSPLKETVSIEHERRSSSRIHIVRSTSGVQRWPVPACGARRSHTGINSRTQHARIERYADYNHHTRVRKTRDDSSICVWIIIVFVHIVV